MIALLQVISQAEAHDRFATPPQCEGCPYASEIGVIDHARNGRVRAELARAGGGLWCELLDVAAQEAPICRARHWTDRAKKDAGLT